MTTSQVSPEVRRLVLFVDRLVMFVTKHWLLLAGGAMFVFFALPLLAPVLMHYGWVGPAQLIYAVYHFECHQLAFRSFFVFGQQSAYTLDQLRSATAVRGENWLYWESFVGNPQLGYKMAWCERDAAIYGSMLLATVLFAMLRSRLKPLDWRIYALLVVPIVIDGGTQLLGLRESDALLRVITGTLFGAGSIWLAYPYLEVGMREAQDQARLQWQRAQARQAARRVAQP